MTQNSSGAKTNRSRPVPPAMINVAVLAGIRHPLTYSLPDSLDVRLGQRLLVPLGARRVIGIALGAAPALPSGIRVREVIRVLDAEPVLTPELLTLGLWIAEYYLAPLGEVFRAMLPLRPETRKVRLAELTAAGRQKLQQMAGSLLDETKQSAEANLLRTVDEQPGVAVESLRRKFDKISPGLVARAMKDRLIALSHAERPMGRKEVYSIRLTGPLESRTQSLSPVARRIVEALDRDGESRDHRKLLKATRASLSHLRKLQQQGIVEFAKASLAEDEPGPASEPPHTMTAPQTDAIEELAGRLGQQKFSVALLHGITASGKTEVYLRLIERALESGRTAMMLVPEIALTPAIHQQFLSRFGNTMALLHSGLGANERHEAWWRLRRGEARVVLGTRSAVFAPVDNLGVIIVDEEHEASYKQEETPRYHGRDAAIVRAQLAKALIVLGSATPSLESYDNVQKGKYHLLTLSERVGGRPLAEVEIVDMREEFRRTQTQVPISHRLKEEVEAQLRSGKQTMFLLNRRGYSWFLLCRSCGQTERCVNCSISLTYHRHEKSLICHYCGYQARVPAKCRACGSEYLYFVGEGTEKLEQKIAEMFPQARVARLDRDAARRPGHFLKILSDFKEGKIDILVGTQLIAKGHDFPQVTLVGIVSADTALALPDFRAAERTFQLLTQAAGRAGRGEARGRVLVQTFYPDHYAIRLAAQQDFARFFAKEIQFRRLMHYPPAAALANVIVQDKKLEDATQIAREVGNFFEQLGDLARGIKILGPGPAPLAKIERLYRIQFLLKAASRARLNAVLRRLADECEQLGIPAHSLMIDMDPTSLM